MYLLDYLLDACIIHVTHFREESLVMTLGSPNKLAIAEMIYEFELCVLTVSAS